MCELKGLLFIYLYPKNINPCIFFRLKLLAAKLTGNPILSGIFIILFTYPMAKPIGNLPNRLTPFSRAGALTGIHNQGIYGTGEQNFTLFSPDKDTPVR